MAGSIDISAASLYRMVELCKQGWNSDTLYTKQALASICKSLLRSLKHISDYLPGPKLRRSVSYRWSRRSNLSCEERVRKQQVLIAGTFSDMYTIVNSGGIVRCSMKTAAQHGEFPLVKELLSMSCRPRFKKIVDTLGKEWLTNRRLKKRAYVVKSEADGDILIEGTSTASEADTASMMGASLSKADNSTPMKRESPSQVLMRQQLARQSLD